MNYISTQDAAKKWGVSLRYVQRLLHDDRIPGAKKYSGAWLIPSDSKKPTDLRIVRKQGIEPLSSMSIPTMSLPKGNPDAALQTVQQEYRTLAAADLAYRRGNANFAKEYWKQIDRSDKTMLSAASLATAAAISSGDYDLYFEIDGFLKNCITASKSDEEKGLLSLPGILAAVGMGAPSMTPEWLKCCDFSIFSPELSSYLLYPYMLHLRNIEEYEGLVYTANAARVLCAQTNTFTWLDLQSLILASTGSFGLGDEAKTKKYLVDALDLGMLYGFIMPFADTLGAFGGLLEQLIIERYPKQLTAVTELWNHSFKNWMDFHNKFTKENIATILTAQEYQVARSIVFGGTCAQTAARMNLSVGRVKNILSDIYGKLHIKKRQQLRQFIL